MKILTGYGSYGGFKPWLADNKILVSVGDDPPSTFYVSHDAGFTAGWGDHVHDLAAYKDNSTLGYGYLNSLSYYIEDGYHTYRSLSIGLKIYLLSATQVKFSGQFILNFSRYGVSGNPLYTINISRVCPVSACSPLGAYTIDGSTGFNAAYFTALSSISMVSSL